MWHSIEMFIFSPKMPRKESELVETTFWKSKNLKRHFVNLRIKIKTHFPGSQPAFKVVSMEEYRMSKFRLHKIVNQNRSFKALFMFINKLEPKLMSKND